MNITVLDFEKVARCYKPYVDGITELEIKSEETHNKINEIQEKARMIMSESNDETLTLNEDILENKKQQAQTDIQVLQQEAMFIDQDFKKEADEKQKVLVEEAYKGITDIVNDFISKNNGVDMVLNRSEVVFFKEEYEITDDIIKLLEEKELYTDIKLN